MKKIIYDHFIYCFICSSIFFIQPTHGKTENKVSSLELVKKPKVPLNTHMARLGQLRDNLDRFWGSKDMQDLMLEMVEEMIEIQKACLKLTPVYIEEAPEALKPELSHYYQFFSLRSLRQLNELYAAINAWELEKAKKVLTALDSNRKRAHNQFG